jgi:hypothetical protein
MSRKRREMDISPDLCRARMTCGIGKAVLNRETTAPDGATKMEYAMYHLLSAVEDIAMYLLKEKERELTCEN